MKCDKCEIDMVKMKSKREIGGKTTYNARSAAPQPNTMKPKKGLMIKNDVSLLQSKAALL